MAINLMGKSHYCFICIYVGFIVRVDEIWSLDCIRFVTFLYILFKQILIGPWFIRALLIFM